MLLVTSFESGELTLQAPAGQFGVPPFPLTQPTDDIEWPVYHVGTGAQRLPDSVQVSVLGEEMTLTYSTLVAADYVFVLPAWDEGIRNASGGYVAPMQIRLSHVL